MVSAFLISLLLVATVPGSSTQALSLTETTQRVTKPIRTLLSPVTQLYTPQQQAQPQTTPSPPAPANNSNSTAPAAPPISQQPASSPNPAPGSQSASLPPTQEMPANMTPLEQVVPITGSGTTGTNVKLVGAMVTNSAKPSSMTDFGWLQATENGWRLFGVLWYWWLIPAVAVVCVYAWRGKLLSIVPWQFALGSKR